MRVALAELELGGAAAPWERLGFAVAGDDLQVGTVPPAIRGRGAGGDSGMDSS